MAEAVLSSGNDVGARVSSPAPPPAPVPIDISILIVTWNSERWIERCLRSLPAACGDLRYEVIVHDNASSDQTLSRMPDQETRVLRSETNAGFAAGTNRAFRESRGRYVFLLNPDCDLEPGALSTLCAFVDEHPHAAGAASARPRPRLATACGRNRHLAVVRPRAPGGVDDDA